MNNAIWKDIVVTKNENNYYNELLSMTGKEIYNKFGLKEDETITITCDFGSGIEADIKLVICDFESKPYTEAVLFENGFEIALCDCEDEMTGDWHFWIDEQEYVVNVIVED